MARSTSGTHNFNPPIADLVISAYERIQVLGNELTPYHIISARREANLLLTGEYSTRGINLWKMELLTVPLTPGQSTYRLPRDTVNVFDSYLRTYTSGSAFANIGAALTPMLNGAGVPMVDGNGEPMVTGAGSGTLTMTTGSVEVLMHWPMHGLAAGAPIFWQMPTEAGGIVFTDTSVVATVVDGDNLTFNAPSGALWNAVAQGSPPLFATTLGSIDVDVILPRHGLAPGSTFDVQVQTVVGGLTIPVGSYTVASVATNYQFSIDPGVGAASSTTAAFENGGQIGVGTQTSQGQYTDIYLWPLSRNEYAMLPNKQQPGRPTQYWLDRQIAPILNTWPVAPVGSTYAFICYRLVQIEDANPVGGQVLDLPTRFLPVFTADLCAALAQIWKPSVWAEKLAYAEKLWEHTANDDIENTSTFMAGDCSGYFS